MIYSLHSIIENAGSEVTSQLTLDLNILIKSINSTLQNTNIGKAKLKLKSACHTLTQIQV